MPAKELYTLKELGLDVDSNCVYIVHAMRERLTHNYEFEFKINPYPGLFIAVEGLDGSGNSTQVGRLKDYFYDDIGWSDRHIKVVEEPTYGPFGAPVNYALRRGMQVDFQTLQLGFTSDRSDHIETEIVPYLKKAGNVLLTARYLVSTIAYGYASGLDFDWLMALQSKFVYPDMVFYLDAHEDVCIERIQERLKRQGKQSEDLFEKKEFLNKVREGYKLFMKKIPGSMLEVNGEESIHNVTKEIVQAIRQHPKKRIE